MCKWDTTRPPETSRLQTAQICEIHTRDPQEMVCHQAEHPTHHDPPPMPSDPQQAHKTQTHKGPKGAGYGRKGAGGTHSIMQRPLQGRFLRVERRVISRDIFQGGFETVRHFSVVHACVSGSSSGGDGGRQCIDVKLCSFERQAG